MVPSLKPYLQHIIQCDSCCRDFCVSCSYVSNIVSRKGAPRGHTCENPAERKMNTGEGCRVGKKPSVIFVTLVRGNTMLFSPSRILHKECFITKLFPRTICENVLCNLYVTRLFLFPKFQVPCRRPREHPAWQQRPLHHHRAIQGRRFIRLGRERPILVRFFLKKTI